MRMLLKGGNVYDGQEISMIAILRAQGIPARAALGYANISERSEGEEG